MRIAAGDGGDAGTPLAEPPRPRSGALRAGLARLPEGCLYVLLLLLPFSKAAIEVMSVLLITAWGLARLDPVSRRQTLWLRPSVRTLAATTGAYLAVCGLSAIGSTDPALSLHALASKWAEYLLLFVIAADVGLKPKAAQRSLLVISWSALAVCVEGLTQELFGKGLVRGYAIQVFGRMTGPYENPIDLGTYFMVVSPILLAAAMARRRLGRWATWALMAMVVLCLARTASIGAWLGLGVGLAVVMAANTSLRRYGVVALAVTLAAGVCFLKRSDRLAKVFSTADVGMTDRLAMWQAAAAMARERPLLGQGLNTFMANYLEFWVGGERQPRYAHNCYLQMAAETGISGLVLFAALLGLIGARLLVGLRRRWGEERLILIGLLGGLCAFAVHAAVDTDFYAMRQAVLFWSLAGIALGYAEASRAEPMRDGAEEEVGRMIRSAGQGSFAAARS